jgi:S1-C subfamily serine protease
MIPYLENPEDQPAPHPESRSPPAAPRPQQPAAPAPAPSGADAAVLKRTSIAEAAAKVSPAVVHLVVTGSSQPAALLQARSSGSGFIFHPEVGEGWRRAGVLPPPLPPLWQWAAASAPLKSLA